MGRDKGREGEREGRVMEFYCPCSSFLYCCWYRPTTWGCKMGGDEMREKERRGKIFCDKNIRSHYFHDKLKGHRHGSNNHNHYCTSNVFFPHLTLNSSEGFKTE